jgi:hypothetical protein
MFKKVYLVGEFALDLYLERKNKLIELVVDSGDILAFATNLSEQLKVKPNFILEPNRVIFNYKDYTIQIDDAVNFNYFFFTFF